MLTTTLSSKNQVTLPKFFLQMLGLSGGDRLLIEIEENQINLKPAKKSIIDLLAKSIKVAKSKKGVSFEKALAHTKKTVARQLATP
ncbi:AbrB/MazE/SpoVT family DNA-binding domain-containing protein [Candidatus Shapirobacteria bacterium]|nr:AbrB/MazE/SpoVT family DNA-binding domain-containing protein [Candidatus Shapirobacteria bacterium]